MRIKNNCSGLVASILVFGALVSGQTTADEISPLHLGMRVLEKKAVAGDSDLCALDMKLELRFTNTSDSTVILPRQAVGVTRIWVSGDERKFRDRVFEMNLTLSVFTADTEPEAITSIESFVELKPGESFTTDDSVVLFFPRTPGLVFEGAIRRGRHVLSIQIVLENFNDTGLEVLRKHFGSDAIIWSKPVVSDLLPFKIEEGLTCPAVANGDGY